MIRDFWGRIIKDIETCIISYMKWVASPGSMHDLDVWGWCTGMTQRDGIGREEGGGFRMGNACIPVADSCWYTAKPIQYCKVKKKKDITASTFFLDHLLWEKPADMLWGHPSSCRQTHIGRNWGLLWTRPCGWNKMQVISTAPASPSDDYSPIFWLKPLKNPQVRTIGLNGF